MEVISSAASVIALVQLVESVITGLKIIGSLRDAPTDATRLAEELSDLQLVLHQSTFAFGQSSNLPLPLKDLLSALFQRTRRTTHALDLVLRQYIFNNSGKAGRFAWVRHGDRIKALREDLRDCKISISLLNTSATLASISIIGTRLDGIEKDILPTLLLNQQANAQTLGQIHDQQLTLISATQQPQVALQPPPNAASLSLISNSRSSQTLNYVHRSKYDKCPPACSCVCHRPVKLNSVDALSKLIGTLHIKYRELPAVAAPCSENGCKRQLNGYASLTYKLPSWLLHRMISLTYSPNIGMHMVLRAPRIVADDALILRFAASGDVTGVKALMAEGLASPGDVGASYGMTALHVAFVKKDMEMIRFLMKHGADPSYETTLRRAVLDIVRDENINGKIPTDQVSQLSCVFDELHDYEGFQFSPLHKSILGISSIDLGSQLAVSTSCIDLPDSLGRTALSAAAWRGDVSAVRILLQHNASANICTPTELSPLHRAIEGQSLQCVKLLVEHGANINHQNKRGRTPLHYACRIADGGAIAGYLLENGADPNRQDHGFGRPVHEVAIYNRRPQLQLLMQHCADMNPVTADGKTPFQLAVCHNNVSILPVESLWDAGVDVNRMTPKGSTILHIAVRFANAQTMRLLCQIEGINLDVDHINTEGLTATDLLDSNPNDSAELRSAFRELRAKLGNRDETNSDEDVDVDDVFEDALSYHS